MIDAIKVATGVDSEEKMTLEFKNDVTANLMSTLNHDLPNDAMILGDKGYIIIPQFFKAKKCFLYEKGEVIESFVDESKSIGYAHQINAINKDILNHQTQSVVVPLVTSLKIQQMMDAIRAKF